MSNTGKYNKRVKIIFKGEATPTALGGTTYAQGDEKDVWGVVEQLSAAEQLRNGLESGNASFRFYFRYQSVKDVSIIDSLQYKEKVFRIVSVENESEADDKIIILANEQR